MFKFSGFKTKFDPTVDEYVQDRLNSQGASPAEPDLDSEELSLVGSSPRILELARSINRSTPSMSSDGSNDTIEIFGELNLDDIEDDLVRPKSLYISHAVGHLIFSANHNSMCILAYFDPKSTL